MNIMVRSRLHHHDAPCRFPRKARRLCKLAAVILVGLSVAFALQAHRTHRGLRQNLQKSSPSDNSKIPGVHPSDDDTKHIMLQRKQHVTRVCSELSMKYPSLQVSNGRFLMYKPLHMAYCVVAKVACTFWIGIFRFLLKDIPFDNIVNPMDITKVIAHSRPKILKHYSINKGREDLVNSTRFLIVRNPYSRLFSAYMDKFLLPDLWINVGPLVSEMFRNDLSKKCVPDVEFLEFLKLVAAFEKSPQHNNGHWKPIYLTCNPCMWKFDIVAKLETFSQDRAYILKQFGLDHFVKNSSHQENSEHQIWSQIQYTFLSMKTITTQCKVTPQFIANRLWEVFQMQGYIKNDSAFPVHALTKTASMAKQFRDIVINEIRTSPMTRIDSRDQKLFFLKKAYSSIPESIIKKIQTIFLPDFKLFNYDIDLNTL